MTWLAAQHSIEKTWLWCKHNCKIVALVGYTVIMYMLFSKNAQSALDALDAAREAHKSEVDVLNSDNSEEIRKRDENLKKYQ